MSRLEFGGHGLDYVDLPDEAPSRHRPPLVFLHEGLGSVGQWRGFPHSLRAALGHPRTIVYSRLGYGRSTALRGGRMLRYMHDEALNTLPRLLAHLDIDPPVLVGHSDGASIALIHAGARHPVQGLVLFAPHVFVEDRTLDGIRAARAAYQAGPLRERLRRHHDDVDAAFFGWSDAWLDPDFAKWNIEEYLPSITAPVLVIQGQLDRYGTAAQAHAIARRCRGVVEVRLVDGVGHAPHLESDEALRLATEFLEDAVPTLDA